MIDSLLGKLRRSARGGVRALALLMAAVFVIPTAVAAMVTTTVSAVTATPAAAATPAATATGHPTPAAASQCPTAAGALCVQAAQDSIAPGPLANPKGQGPSKNDPVTTYKWILNEDNSGYVTFGADGKTPKPSEVAECHPHTLTSWWVDAQSVLRSKSDLDALGGTLPAGAFLTDFATPHYPNSCPWPSIRTNVPDPVVSSGDNSNWNSTTNLPAWNATTHRGLKPNAHYLVSVTSNGYELGGAHFATNAAGVPTSVVIVNLNPWPLPLANIRLVVYGDMASANNQWDEQSETGLSGFTAQFNDYDGPVRVDGFANPLCTAYKMFPDYLGTTNAAGANNPGGRFRIGRTTYNVSSLPNYVLHPDPTSSYYQVKLGLDGKPIIDPTRHYEGIDTTTLTGAALQAYLTKVGLPPYFNAANAGAPAAAAGDAVVLPGYAGDFLQLGPSNGQCTSDPNGNILVPNMVPNHYTSSVTPPDNQLCAVAPYGLDGNAAVQSDRACWVQTTTLEGNHDFDTWVQANTTGYDTELVVGGENVSQVQFGFVRAGCIADPVNGNVDQASLLANPGTGGRVSWYAPGDPQCANAPTPKTTARNTGFGRNAQPPFNAVAHTLTVATTAGFPPSGTLSVTHGAFTITLTYTGITGGFGGFGGAGSFTGVAVTSGNASSIAAGDAVSQIASGGIKGRIRGANAYYPGIGALPGVNGNAGVSGYKFENQQWVSHTWVALSDLNNGDKTVAVKAADQNGDFSFTGVPDGSYSVALWDQPQEYIFDSLNVTVANGQVVDLGPMPLVSWSAHIFGHVFIDSNGNGRMDPGEKGVPDFLLQNLQRNNTAQEGGVNTAKTTDSGSYDFPFAYPLGYDQVIQAFNTRWKTIGVTYQACNDPKEHTLITPLVDVSYTPIISQCGRLDWGVQPYDAKAGDNGGIVATVMYDSVRNRYLGRQQVAYDHQAGIPGLLTELFAPVKKDDAGAPTTITCNGVSAAPQANAEGYLLNCDGSYLTTGATGGYSTTYSGNAITATDRAPGAPNAYQSEIFNRGTGCVAQDANGNGIQGSYLTGNPAIPTVTGDPTGATLTATVTDFLPALDASAPCMESSATGIAFGFGTDNQPLDPNLRLATDPVCVALAAASDPTYATKCSDLHGSQTVDGNFALTPTDAQGNPTTGFFLAKVDLGGDKILPQVDGNDAPLYKVADEASMNYVPTGLNHYTSDVFDPALLTDLAKTKSTDGHASMPMYVPQNADLGHVYNPDGSLHANLGNTDQLGHTPVALTFPPQAGPPTQTPQATPVIGGDSPSSYIEDPNTASPVADPQCAGAVHTIDVTDPGFLSVGGSPLQGAANAASGAVDTHVTRNSCDIHLLHAGAGQSVAPNFFLYTDVPIPARFSIQNFDDTNISTNKFETQYGDAAPVPNSPEGIYDWAGNLIAEDNMDPNGLGDVLLPSMDSTQCPVPAGMCQRIYRFVGNDPGTIDHPNANFNPQIQTITANFQALPGSYVLADTAPVRSAVQFIASGQKFIGAADCSVAVTSPQLFAVDRPYTDYSNAHPRTINIKGIGFGASKGSSTVTLTPETGAGNVASKTTPAPAAGGTALATTSWSDTAITATVPNLSGGFTGGAYQLTVTKVASGQSISTTNGITYHVIDTTRPINTPAHPTVLEVAPVGGTVNGAVLIPSPYTAPTSQNSYLSQRAFPSIQEAIERAAGYWLRPVNGTLTYTNINAALPNAVVVVYPALGATSNSGPDQVNNLLSTGTWYEPIIEHSAVDVQGVGPGGVVPSTTAGLPSTLVPGTVLDNRYYFSLTDSVTTPPAAINWGTAPLDLRAQHSVDVWQAIATTLFPNSPAPDNQLVTEGQGVTVLGQNGQVYTSTAHPQLDGFTVRDALELGNPVNVDANTGTRTGATPPADATQGGAIFLNGHTDYTQITNNVISGNQGSYGSIRIGTTQLDGQHNWHVELGHNQIVANGGNNLGGGLAIFNDAGGYQVHDNLICGNQSGEYGGGMSQYGLSIAPVSGTGTISGNTLTVPTNASPFTNGDTNQPITIVGTTGAAYATVGNRTTAGTNTRITLNTARRTQLPNGPVTFDFVPTAAASQANANVINRNLVKLNQSQDEGGGIMLAGQLPAVTTQASQGTGPVNVTNNTIAVNAANDDGGGIRFLQAGDFPMWVANNVITDNVSAHEGGGISLDDTSQVTIINDTIAKNVTTATAATSDGTAAPAGISTAPNSAPFMNALRTAHPTLAGLALNVSIPVIANDVLYDNRAGQWDPTRSQITGIGLAGDTTLTPNVWDIGIVDHAAGLLSPVGSLISTFTGGPLGHPGQGWFNVANSHNVFPTSATAAVSTVDPKFVQPFDLQLQVAALRTYFRLRPTAVVNIGLPGNTIGNYEMKTAAPGVGIGFFSSSLFANTAVIPVPPFPNGLIAAPTFDIDGRARSNNNVDAGADQVNDGAFLEVVWP